MINILSNKVDPRLKYVCEVVFRYIIKTPYQIIQSGQLESNDSFGKIIHINYGIEEYKNGIKIPDIGLLHREDFEKVEIEIKKDQFPKLFVTNNSDIDIDFDLFSAVFYHIRNRPVSGSRSTLI